MREARKRRFEILIGDFSQKEINYFNRVDQPNEESNEAAPDAQTPEPPTSPKPNPDIPPLTASFVQNMYYLLEKEFEPKKRFCKLAF